MTILAIFIRLFNVSSASAALDLRSWTKWSCMSWEVSSGMTNREAWVGEEYRARYERKASRAGGLVGAVPSSRRGISTSTYRVFCLVLVRL